LGGSLRFLSVRVGSSSRACAGRCAVKTNTRSYETAGTSLRWQTYARLRDRFGFKVRPADLPGLRAGRTSWRRKVRPISARFFPLLGAGTVD